MREFFRILLIRWDELVKLLIEHIEMTSVAVLLSLVVGVVIGVLISKQKKMASVVIGIANLMQSIPSIGLLAFMVPFVGIGQKPAIIMIIIYALLPIIKNTYTGITGIDPKLLEAASGIGLSKWQQLIKIQLPLALPFIMAGIRISAVTAVGTVTIAAFAGAGGLGWMINLGLNANDANLVLLGAIPACLLALAVDWVLGKLEKAITPEGLKPADQIVYLPRKKRVLQRNVALLLCGALLIVPTFSSLYRTMHKNQDRLVIGAENFTEALILGDLYYTLIHENTDIPIEKTFNLNGTIITMAALESGDIDMVTDYTGVLAPNVLKLPVGYDPKEVYTQVSQGMLDQFGVETSRPLGCSNDYILAVDPGVAEKYQLNTLSDLVRCAPQLRLGCTTAFTQRGDLLPKMKSELGVQFKEVTGLEGNIRYQAIMSGEVDLIDAYSTDAMIAKAGLVCIEDDIQFFPPYECVNLVRSEVFDKYPELRPLLARLEGAITNQEMLEMNYQVDVEGKTTEETAREFLKAKGLI